MKPLALVIDDEQQMRQIISFALETVGLDTVLCRDSRSGWHELQDKHFDLVVLDIMLPDISGLTLCRRIRSHSDVKILMLSALGDVDERVQGLEAGADDYLSKPFSPRELALRAQVLTKRSSRKREDPTDISLGNVHLIEGTHRIAVDDKVIDLSETEALLLRTLITTSPEVADIHTILGDVWGTSSPHGGRGMVKTTVYRLRKKLIDSDANIMIEAVRGQGYVCAHIE